MKRDPLFPWEEIRERYSPSPLWVPKSGTVSALDARLRARAESESHPAHPQLGGTVITEDDVEDAAAFLQSVLAVARVPAEPPVEGETTNPGRGYMKTFHVPVLADEVLELLSVRSGGLYVDATLGGGGHTTRILEAAPDVRVIGVDQDTEALEAAAARLERFGDRFVPLHGNFVDLGSLLADEGIDEPIDGILMDLGVSSHHFDASERGFSFSSLGPLDMRMDLSQETTAADLVNTLSQGELARIIREYGEEPLATRIAAQILMRRASAPLRTTSDLVEVVQRAYGKRAHRSRRNPATRTFQALRIAVNRELDVLQAALPGAFDRLAPGGRLVVISYHSLEDRITKQFMVSQTTGCVCPPEIPVCRCGRKPHARRVTSKPIRAGAEEEKWNPRSRSARLRAIEKVSS